MDKIYKKIAEELNIRENQVEATVKLIDDGNTIPFIARYRKEVTGNLSDETLRDLDERLKYLRNLEARNPKGLAIITEISGTVKINEEKKRKEVIVTSKDNSKTYVISFGSKLKVKDGDEVEAGDPLTEGSINPNDLLAIKGPEGVYRYIIAEVQKVYRNQGVDINDKHIEVIARQMLKKVRIEDPGDTGMYTASLVELLDFEEKNAEMIAQGKRPATGKRTLLGITKASLATESFLSAASFQETTKVLTEAAIKGKEDSLTGLKENVIIGKLIPTGTGLKYYQDLEINTKLETSKKVEESDENSNDLVKDEGYTIPDLEETANDDTEETEEV